MYIHAVSTPGRVVLVPKTPDTHLDLDGATVVLSVVSAHTHTRALQPRRRIIRARPSRSTTRMIPCSLTFASPIPRGWSPHGWRQPQELAATWMRWLVWLGCTGYPPRYPPRY